MNSGLRVMLQWTTKPRVVAEQQMNISQQATSAQRTGVYPRAVFQQTANSRVVSSWQIDMSLQVVSVQQMSAYLRVVL